jgi:hypothetical protein
VSNPTTPFPFYSFVPDEDSGKLNQDFDALVAFLTTGVIHTHHVDSTSYTFGSIALNGNTDVTVTFNQPFAPGVTPVVHPSLNTTAAVGTNGIDLLNAVAYAITASGCTVRIKNLDGTNPRGGGTLAVTAIDPNYDVSQ